MVSFCRASAAPRPGAARPAGRKANSEAKCSNIGNPIPATNEGMVLDDDGNMVDSAITSYEGNINALNSVNIHRIRTYMPRSSRA